MKTKLLLISFLIVVFSQFKANGQFSVSLDVSPQFAMEGYSNGLGGNIGFGWNDVGVRVGYSSFKSSVEDVDIDLTMNPVTIYYNYFIGKGKFRGLFCGDVGAVFMKTTGSLTSYYTAVSTKPSSYGKKYTASEETDLSSSKLYFGGGAGVGLDYKLSNSFALFSCVKIHYVLSDPSTSWFGANFGTRYSFGKKE